MNYSILSFKKKLGFVSLLVLASFSLSQQCIAMDVDGGEDECVEENQNNGQSAAQEGKKPTKKRKADDTNKKNNKKQKLAPSSNGSTTGEGSSIVAHSFQTRAQYSGDNYEVPNTPEVAGILIEMDAWSKVDPSPVSSAVSYTSMPTTTAASSSTTTTTTSTPSLAGTSVAPIVPYILPPASLNEINVLIAQAKWNNVAAQSKLMQYFYHGLYMSYPDPQKIDFLNWKSPNPGQTFQAYCTENDFYTYFVLAHFHKIGTKFPDLLEAIKRRANQGDLHAQNILGYAYWDGKGVAQDLDQAVKYYQLAADQGFAVAQYNLGRAYWDGKGVVQNFGQAVTYFKLAADQGYAGAQTKLGRAYWDGKGVVQNFGQAVTYFKLAADQGYAGAQTKLGRAYWDGKGVVQNFGQAVTYFKLAADQGYAEAQTNLGRAYWDGKGVVQNFGQAVTYFKLAADQGLAVAQTNLGYAYAYGNRVVLQDFGQAVKYYQLAADQGFAGAQNNLGRAYWDGKGVVQNFGQAVTYFKLAADQGYAAAQTNLGRAYWDGKGVAQDLGQAVKYYQLAADQGFAVAQTNLSNAYEHGKGVRKNVATALYYKMASKDTSHVPFVVAHLSYVPFVTWQNETCVDKLKKIIDNEHKATPQGGLAFLLKRHQERKEKEKKQDFPIPEISQLYKNIVKIEQEAINLFNQLPQAIKGGFMVPGIAPSSPEVIKGYEEQSLPRQLGSYVMDNINYLTLGKKSLKLQDLLLGIDEKFTVIDQAFETLNLKFYKKTEYDALQQELFSKRANPQPEVQEECKKLYARMQSLSKPLMEIQEERAVLAQIRREAKSFIPSTAKDRQDIFLSEYPHIPRQK